MSSDPEDPLALIPSLAEWSGPRGRMGPADWAGAMGTYEHAIGYTFCFWPDFVLVRGHVLRADVYSEENLRAWEKAAGGDRGAVEAVINHVHIHDLHPQCDPSEVQIRFLGRRMKAMLEAKLATDFPGRAFAVTFNDEPGLEAIEYQLTFRQRGPSGDPPA